MCSTRKSQASMTYLNAEKNFKAYKLMQNRAINHSEKLEKCKGYKWNLKNRR